MSAFSVRLEKTSRPVFARDGRIVQSRSCGQAMSGSCDSPVFWRDGDLPQTHAVARFCTEENPVVHPLGRRGNQTRKGQADILRCKGCERPGLDRRFLQPAATPTSLRLERIPAQRLNRCHRRAGEFHRATRSGIRPQECLADRPALGPLRWEVSKRSFQLELREDEPASGPTQKAIQSPVGRESRIASLRSQKSGFAARALK